MDLPSVMPLNNLMNLISPMGLKTCFHWNSDIEMNQDIPLLKWDHCGLFSQFSRGNKIAHMVFTYIFKNFMYLLSSDCI